VTVGMTEYGDNVADSGVLPATASSYSPPTLPGNRTLFATVYTEVRGGWSRFQSIEFTTRAAMGTLANPRVNQTGVATPATFSWLGLYKAQGTCSRWGPPCTGTTWSTPASWGRRGPRTPCPSSHPAPRCTPRCTRW